MKFKFLVPIIMIIILKSTMLAAASPYYYNISMTYDNGNFTVNSVNIVYSVENPSLNQGDYTLLLKSNNNELTRYNFSIDLVSISENFNEQGLAFNGTFEVKNNLTFNIFIPYEKNADNLVIFANNTEKSVRQISEYSKKSLSEKQIDELKKDSINKSFNKTTSSKSPNNLIYYILGIILLFTLIFLIYKLYSQKK